MPHPEAFYQIPATADSIGRFIQLSSSLLEYALPGPLSDIETEVLFRQTHAATINIHRPTEEHLSDVEFSIAVNFNDKEGKSDISFLITKFGEIKRRNWRNRFDVGDPPTVIEGGIFAGKSPEEIANINKSFEDEIRGLEEADELGYSIVTEGELLDVIEQLEDIDPETQLIQEE